MQHDIDYNDLTQKALLEVVKQVLLLLVEQGDLGLHHFYITFKLNAKGVVVPEYLAARYINEMTIVLQHQFENLKINNDGIEVSLSFDGSFENIKIPFHAIVDFRDPYANFNLQFDLDDEDFDDDIVDIHNHARNDDGCRIINLDDLRKK